LFTTSCKKKEQVAPPYVNTFSANVNGATFTPQSIDVLFGGSSIPNARQVNIYAKRAADEHQVVLIMLNFDGTLQTFTKLIGAYVFAPGLYNSSSNINGEIRISSIDKSRYQDGDVVTGTFHFDTDPTAGAYNITNGNFSVFVKR
jgi:hypothetical protein